MEAREWRSRLQEHNSWADLLFTGEKYPPSIKQWATALYNYPCDVLTFWFQNCIYREILYPCLHGVSRYYKFLSCMHVIEEDVIEKWSCLTDVTLRWCWAEWKSHRAGGTASGYMCILYICSHTLQKRAPVGAYDKPSVKWSTPDNFDHTDHDAMTKSTPTNSFWF